MRSERWAGWLGRVQEWALYLFAVLLPFSKAAIEIAFVILLAAWLLERLLPGARRPTAWSQPAFRPMALAGVAFLGACALSIAGSKFPRESLEGLVGKWLEYLLYTVVLVDVAARPRVVKRLLRALAVATGFVIVEACWQELTGRGLFRGYPLGMYGRMTGPYENPIDLATFFMVITPVLLCWCLTLLGRAKWMVGAVLLGVAACLGRTEASGAWLGLLAGLAVIAARDPKMRRATLAAGIAVVLVCGIWLSHTGRLASTFSPTETGTSDRWVMWQAGAKMVAARPLLGHGVNTFMANYLDYWVGGERMPRYAHNCYLQVAAETGLIGLAAFVALLGLIWRRLWAALTPPLADQQMWLLGLLGGLTAFLVQAGLDTNFYALRQAALFWALTGVALGLSCRVGPAARRP